jgi:tight adherence protein B
MEFVVAIVFLLILAIIVGPYWFFVIRPEDEQTKALKKRLKTPRMLTRSPGFVKARERLSNVGALEVALARAERVAQPLHGLIARAGLNVNVGTIVLASVFCAVAALAVLTQLQSSLLIALGGAAAAATVPILYVRSRAQRRLAIFEEQFPEAIDLMARALRAGHALTTALQMVGEEVPDPIGGEFKLGFDQQNYGMSLPEALRSLAARVPILDARIFVTALLTQRESGGNLSEILDNLAHVVRERFKIRRQIRVHTAHGRFTGYVLLALPAALAIALSFINPEHMQLLFHERMGQMMLMGAIVMQTIGFIWIKQVIKIEV